jgi:hypothetical protein
MMIKVFIVRVDVEQIIVGESAAKVVFVSETKGENLDLIVKKSSDGELLASLCVYRCLTYTVGRSVPTHGPLKTIDSYLYGMYPIHVRSWSIRLLKPTAVSPKKSVSLRGAPNTRFAWAGGTCPRFAWAGRIFSPVTSR